jgi:hypothetical protein
MLKKHKKEKKRVTTYFALDFFRSLLNVAEIFSASHLQVKVSMRDERKGERNLKREREIERKHFHCLLYLSPIFLLTSL